MRIYKIFFYEIIIIASLLSNVLAKPAVKEFNYYSALTEYYSQYCDKIGARELEETYILMYSGRYSRHEKDEQSKQQDFKEVGLKLRKVIEETRKGTHEYSITLISQIGEYNELKGSFECNVIAKGSCIDLLPSAKDVFDSSGEDRIESVIARGVLFGKVSKIKLFFNNSEEFKNLKMPLASANKFIKSRTNDKGQVNRAVYAVLTFNILPKNKCEREWLGLAKYVYVPGMGSNYYEVAQIRSIEIFDGMDLKIRLGELAEGTRILDAQ